MNQGRDLLTRVDYPDGSAKLYHYENTSFPTYLTGISNIDASAVTTRYATYGYDAQGNANSTEHSGGAQHYDIAYNLPTKSTVTDAGGGQRVLTFAPQLGVRKLISSVDAADGKAFEQTFDANNNLSCSKDEEGRVTTYTYNGGNQKLSMMEGRTGTCASPVSTGATRTTTYTYVNSATDLLATISEPSVATALMKTTTYSYADTANPTLPTTITTSGSTPSATAVSRSVSYTYNGQGQVLTINGPRTDVSDVVTYTYYSCSTGYQCGQVATVTNALSQATAFNTYNAYGQPLTITDPNGVVTTLAYDTRQRLVSRTVGTQTTTFDYSATGRLSDITQPDGSSLAFTYDSAQRLVAVTDGDGNHIAYTLDAMGNRIKEEIFDPGSALVRQLSRTFDLRNHIIAEIGAAETSAVTTAIEVDALGNRLSIDAPLSRTTVNQYDALNRLTQITDPGSEVTEFGYDLGGQLASVVDPNGNTTTYSYDDLGNLLEQQSPDTGATAATFDAAGNLSTSTDARTKTGTYSYDALNRPTQLAYSDQTITYTYDTGTNNKGRLMQVSDNSGSTSWTYTSLGRVASRTQSMGVNKIVSYGYNSAGQLTSITTPSGQVLAYSYSNNQISGITLNTSTTLLDDVIYDPFGPTKGWTWGNSTLAVREYDLDGNLTDIDSAGLNTYTYDDAFRITEIEDALNSALTWDYGYDALDRLTSASKTALSQTWTYDANGNRLTQGGTASSTFSIASTSNRLSGVSGALSRTYSYDAAGHVTGDGTYTFTYDDAGRMTAVSGGASATYAINALGQRVKKTVSSVSTYFVYDDAGHLIGEYDGSGNLIQEIVWLNDIPVATIQPNGGSGIGVFYIHTDHLNTPRKLTRPTDNVVVWRWDGDPFGTNLPDQDPDGNSAQVVFNLRFAGQYYDNETGLHYNWHRDYEPISDRYLESDLIGLAGGLNTYTYVSGNPITFVDPYGLFDMPPLPQGFVDFSAGLGDGLLLGLGDALRNAFGIDGGVDLCSKAYGGGDLASYAASGAGAGVKLGFKTVSKVITGYTRHGLNQAISREGRGVSASSILNAVRNPASTAAGRGGTTIYRGADGTTVVLNKGGKVVTTYGVPRGP